MKFGYIITCKTEERLCDLCASSIDKKMIYFLTSEPNGFTRNYKNYVACSTLLPLTSATFKVDGTPEQFRAAYYTELNNNPNAQTIICDMIYRISKGIDIVLCCASDSDPSMFLYDLIQYIIDWSGISIIDSVVFYDMERGYTPKYNITKEAMDFAINKANGIMQMFNPAAYTNQQMFMPQNSYIPNEQSRVQQLATNSAPQPQVMPQSNNATPPVERTPFTRCCQMTSEQREDLYQEILDQLGMNVRPNIVTPEQQMMMQNAATDPQSDSDAAPF